MLKLKLNQALAREAQEKERAAEGAKWYTAGVRSMVMDGWRRTYEAVDAEGEPLAPEEKVVQDNWFDVLATLRSYHFAYINAVGTKDCGNVHASADLVIGAEVIIEAAPVPYLLFLEKTVGAFRGWINQLPTRDRAYRWTDVDAHLAETEPTSKNRTIKQQVPIQLAEATTHHKAQVSLVEKAVHVGTYQTTNITGAIGEALQEHYLRRCDILLVAIRHARESANTTEIEPVEVADRLFAFMFRDPADES